jgi:hypothetical protein
MTPPPRATGSTPGFGRGGVGKHTRLKIYPANPATGVEGGENPLPDGENPRRVGYPAPTRQNPATGVEGGENPLPDGENPCRVGYLTPPLLSGGVGWVSGGLPDKGFCDKEGHNPHLEGGLSGLSGGFSGGVLPPPRAGCIPGGVPGTDFADKDGRKPLFRGRACRVLPGACRVVYPAPILPMGMGKNPLLRGTCRVCRVGLQGGCDAG